MEDHLTEVKLTRVRDYVASQFPDYAVVGPEEAERADGYDFKVLHGNRVAHHVRIINDFLEDHTVSEIERFVRDHRLAEKLRKAEKSCVFVTNSGLLVKAPG